MPASIPTLAEAVKSALNAGTFSQEVTAQRVYVPLLKLEAATTLRVSVLAVAEQINNVTRAGQLREVPINIGIQKKVTADPTTEAANAEIDPLMQLVEEIVGFFGAGTKYGDAQWVRTANAPIYDAERLLSTKEFLSIVSVTFKL